MTDRRARWSWKVEDIGLPFWIAVVGSDGFIVDVKRRDMGQAYLIAASPDLYRACEAQAEADRAYNRWSTMTVQGPERAAAWYEYEKLRRKARKMREAATARACGETWKQKQP